MKYKYIYGPVPSWRLGSSLGIDPISVKKKICTFNCIYCQLGNMEVCTGKRRVFVPEELILKEIKSLPNLQIDYITFSGTGEPTLARNFGKMIKEVRKIRKNKIAVITNSSLIDKKDVQEDLSLADFVVAKLDAPSQALFELVNRPAKGIKIENIIQAMKDFRSCYKGKFALQIMFIEENKRYASEIAKIAKEINPDEVQINTPLRPCKVKPLSEEELNTIEKCFKGLKTVTVYKSEKKKVIPISSKNTLKRRGKYVDL